MLSIVIPSCSPQKLAAVTAHYHCVFRQHPHEIVAITDARSLCEAYNRGLDRSRGDPVIFSHDDVEALLPHTFAARLLRHLETFDVVGVAGTSRLVGAGWAQAGPPHIFGQVLHPADDQRFFLAIFGNSAPINPAIQAMDGLFLAFRRPVIARLRWDEHRFDGFHLYDIDVTFRAYLAGYRLAVAADLPLFHASGGKFNEAWRSDAQRFIDTFRPALLPVLHPPAQFTCVTLPSRAAALPLLTPPHWLNDP